jgi:predicted ABC-type sugar transport system permease subunit
VQLASPRDASRHGISIIHQELSLVPELHVDENIFLGQERLRAMFFVDRKSQIKSAREVLAVGAATGIIIAKGKLQPFIVTLAMMVAVTGALRLIAGPTAAIYPIYSGTNAPADVDMLRGDLFGILPIQGVFFLLLVIIFGFLLKFTSFGCYVYAIGGNEQAARVAGIRVDAA